MTTVAQHRDVEIDSLTINDLTEKPSATLSFTNQTILEFDEYAVTIKGKSLLWAEVLERLNAETKESANP